MWSMWSKSYSKNVRGLSVEKIWAVWTNVNQWHTWQPDIEQARIEGAFEVGNTFMLKPKRGPSVNIEIIRAEPFRQFTDLTRFPGARMYGSHEFIQHESELEIKTTMSIEGPLSFIWKKLVAEDVAAGMAEQTDSLINIVRNG
jgi:hypothetical protein